jgi:hypothetical protein
MSIFVASQVILLSTLARVADQRCDLQIIGAIVAIHRVPHILERESRREFQTGILTTGVRRGPLALVCAIALVTGDTLADDTRGPGAAGGTDEYPVTGVKTLIVSNYGVVYQKVLGL